VPRRQRRSMGTLRVTRRWGRKKLVARLLDDSGEGQLSLMQWAGTASSREVTNLLLAVLRRHSANDGIPTGYLYTAAFLMAMLLLILALFYFQGAEFVVLPFLPFFVCAYIIRQEERRPRIARQAALMLARINDERAIPYLAKAWREKPTAKQENESVTDELTRLAIEACRPGKAVSGAGTLRRFIMRRFPLSSSRDLTDGETDMFLAILRLLAQGDNPRDWKVLKTVSQLEISKPNHALVVEVTRQMLEPTATPSISSPAILPPHTTIVPPVEQVQQNRRS
jgi:hypothetical protein